MFDQLLGLVKDQVAKTVGGIEGVPADKTGAVVDTTASSLMSGLQKFATPDKLSAMLGGGGGASGLSGGVVQALTSKVGLSPTVAKSIAAAAIPAVLALLKKQSGGGGLQSLVGALAGGSGSGGGLGAMLGGLAGGSGSGGGLLGKLGGLFGKG